MGIGGKGRESVTEAESLVPSWLALVVRLVGPFCRCTLEMPSVHRRALLMRPLLISRQGTAGKVSQPASCDLANIFDTHICTLVPSSLLFT